MTTLVNLLRSLDINQLEQAYRSDLLVDHDDDSLFEACVVLLTHPFKQTDSFLMHAPLELMARRRLMAMLPIEKRALPRFQMVATAVVYHHRTKDGTVSTKFVPEQLNAQDVCHAIDAGQPEQAHAVSSEWAKSQTPAALVQSLAIDWLSRPACGAHAHLYLAHLDQLNVGQPGAAQQACAMVGTYAQELARRPGLQLHWDSVSHAVSNDRASVSLLDALLSVQPKRGAQANGIEPMVLQAVEAGLLKQLAALMPSHDAQESIWHQCFESVLLIALQSMLAEPPWHAKYGWTHCLTLPLAAYELYRAQQVSARQALTMAALFVAAFRMCIATVNLSPYPLGSVSSDNSGEATFVASALEAAMRSDAHLVKYVLACHDVVNAFPMLHSSAMDAIDRLLALWTAEVPQAEIFSHLADR